MKLLIIPDIHGRDFWINACQNIEEYDKIIFLGDYHDPYPFQVSERTSRKRLENNLIPFINNNRDKVVCLKGNHDHQYIVKDPVSRYDYFYSNVLKDIFESMDLQLAYRVDNFLFSHSGILPEWLNSNNLTLEDVLNNNVSDKALFQVSPKRGGWDKCGSCIWGDLDEYEHSEKIPGIYQIFGHTMLYPKFEPVITSKFACLDTMKCYTLDTEAGYESLTETH